MQDGCAAVGGVGEVNVSSRVIVLSWRLILPGVGILGFGITGNRYCFRIGGGRE